MSEIFKNIFSLVKCFFITNTNTNHLLLAAGIPATESSKQWRFRV
jgi:hypothetical protein